MANYYYYFIASLPMLHFDMKPPFSLEVFLNKCRQSLSESDYKTISTLPEAGEGFKGTPSGNTIIKRWLEFDTLLRNELVKIRASHRHIEPSRYLRPDGCASQAIPHTALTAHRNTSVLEGEHYLDRERWNALSELEGGHFFDIAILICYVYKLKILERWERTRTADKKALLERALQNA